MKDILISRDSKGKIRVVEMSCEWNNALHAYVINRSTGLLDGKMVEQPIVTIERGKSTRTVTQQAELEYLSKRKGYLDKGYRNISDFGPYTSLDQFNPYEVFPEVVTDQNGAMKPQLCKKYEDVAPATFEKQHYASKKLDGVRCMIRNTESGLRTSSRGGGDYDIPATHILNDPTLIEFFESYPDVILDGELYRHGYSLQKLSGMCRKITLEPEHELLQYHIYDVADTEKPFDDRLDLLNEAASEFFDDSDRIFICDHVITNSWDDIKTLHDKWVAEGYEGCVIRNPEKEYAYGKKDNRMIKIKQFSDLEATIMGLTEGLREEDFVFQMVLDNGVQFEAKPMGTRELRQEYRDNIVGLIGKKGTIKFFEYSPDGVPLLPIFKSVRTEEDL